jgi:hypothetical protein
MKEIRTLVFKKILEKKGAKGRYLSMVDANDNWFSCFDAKLLDEFKTDVPMSVEIENRNYQGKEFHNIVGIEDEPVLSVVPMKGTAEYDSEKQDDIRWGQAGNLAWEKCKGINESGEFCKEFVVWQGWFYKQLKSRPTKEDEDLKKLSAQSL